jgi:hypothetical protein
MESSIYTFLRVCILLRVAAGTRFFAFLTELECVFRYRAPQLLRFTLTEFVDRSLDLRGTHAVREEKVQCDLCYGAKNVTLHRALPEGFADVQEIANDIFEFACELTSVVVIWGGGNRAIDERFPSNKE